MVPSPCISSSFSGSAGGLLLLIFGYFLWCMKKEQEVQLQVRCPLSSSSASAVFQHLHGGLLLTSWNSSTRRTLRTYTTPSSVQTRCWSVMSLLQSHTADFHLSASFSAGFPDPFPTSAEGEQKTDSPNSTNFPRYGPPMAR